ncbi:MAG TPA: mercuric reductase [Longimicrobiaceae bacterium]|nr:mercuric reductase [Longimicrobiaceae bacterium]
MEPLILPADDNNRELLRNVHPPGWQNPLPRSRYHLVVLGGGTAGLVSAAIAAGLGARVALVERNLMGGDCLNTGCVPSKALLRAARAWHDARTAHAKFGGPSAGNDGDFAAVMERMRRIRAAMSSVDSADRFSSLGVDVFLGHGRFTGPERLEVAGDTLRFRRAIIATGGAPVAPPIDGLAEAGFHTSETIFSLTEMPARLLIVGAGPIGCELAQAFARFGSRVTLLDAASRILPRADPEAAAVVQRSLTSDGVRILADADIRAVDRQNGAVTVDVAGIPRPIAGDEVLVAVGRAPRVEGLGLDEALVRHTRDGIETDERLRTTNERIFAIGDVASDQQFTHLADAHARMAVPNALFFGRSKKSNLIVPNVTYTDPEIAQVGLSPDELTRRADEIETITIPLSDVDRATIDGNEDGFLRVHVRSGGDDILGASIVGPNAGELISHITTAMTRKLGLLALGKTIFPYPTESEAIRKAADALRRKKLTPKAKAGFGVYFRMWR